MSFFQMLTHTFSVLPPRHGVNLSLTNAQTFPTSHSMLSVVKEMAEAMALDVVLNFDTEKPKKPPNKYCMTMRRVVKELSDRHDLVFKGMVNKLKPDEDNSFSTFVIVADELFSDCQVNWGRIVAVYTFAARFAKYYRDNNATSSSFESSSSTPQTPYEEKIALFLGKYVASKLGQWVLDHGGWDAFVEFFPDQKEFEEKLWKGLWFTAIGFGALATMVASR